MSDQLQKNYDEVCERLKHTRNDNEALRLHKALLLSALEGLVRRSHGGYLGGRVEGGTSIYDSDEHIIARDVLKRVKP